MCTFASKDTCLGYSIAYITRDWKYHIVALGVVPHNHGHSAEQVAKTLRTQFHEVFSTELEDILSSIKSDTASSAVCVAKKFELEPELCAMHCGDLAMSYACGIKFKDGDEFEDGINLVLKHSALAAHFSRSTKDFAALTQVRRP